MNRANIDLPVGPELDAALARIVGLDVNRDHEPGESYADCECYQCGRHCQWGKDFDGPCIPLYSESISYMVNVAEEMRSTERIANWSVIAVSEERRPASMVVVQIGDPPVRAPGTTPAHSLALAIVRALSPAGDGPGTE